MTIYRRIYRSFFHFVTFSTLLSYPPRCSVHGTALIIRSLSSPFSPSAPLITPEMIFFCAPLYIYAPFVASFRTFLLRSFAFVMTGITNILNFLLRLVHVSYTRSLVFDYAFYNLLKIFNFFKIKFFKSNERKIIHLERLLYRTMAFSVWNLFLKNRILRAILVIQPVCFTCMMKK